MLQKLKNLFKKKQKKIQLLPIEENIYTTKNLKEWSEYLFVKYYKCPQDFYLNNLTISEFYNKLSNCNIEFYKQGHILFEKFCDNPETITCPVCQKDYTWYDFRKFMIFNDRTNQFVCRECLKNNH